MKQLSAEEFLQSLDTLPIVLDVRTPEEYARGHIHKSICTPLDNFEEKIAKVAPDKTTPVYIYCFSGSRSSIAMRILQDLGYTHTFELEHGLLSWRIKGYPLEK